MTIKFSSGIVRIIITGLILAGIGVGIYLVQHPQIFSPKASDMNISASMGAGPNPCFIPAGQTTCTAIISWKAYTNQPVKILVRETGGLFATGAFGSQTAPWITETPVNFDLYIGDTLTISTAVKGSSILPQAYIYASNNPCIIPVGNSTCTSTINWKFDIPVEIRIKGNPGSIFAKGQSGAQAAPWITTSGVTFQVFYNNVLQEELFVRGTNAGTNASTNPNPTPSPSASASSGQSGSNLISASPVICNIPTGGETCSSTISWNAAGKTDVKIRVREAPGSLFASGVSGSQVAPWIRESGATFDLYSGNTLLNSVFVKGQPGNGSSLPTTSPLGFMTASVNPCNISSGSETCSSAISWNAAGKTDVKIRIREVPNSLFASGPSGSQVAPWIRVSGATFDLYSGNTLVDSLFVKGAGPSPSPINTKKGDLNNDGQVDALDYNIFLQDYAGNNLRSDLNGDGQVDALDYNILLQNFGN